MLAALVASAMLAGCGGSSARSTEQLCQSLLERRLTGIHAPLRKHGPEHRDAFLSACVRLPKAYLECEHRDALYIDRECNTLLQQRPYRRQLDQILLSGWVGAKRKPRPAGIGPADAGPTPR